VPVGPNGDVRG